MPGEGTVDGEVSSCLPCRKPTDIGDMSMFPGGWEMPLAAQSFAEDETPRDACHYTK